MRSSSTKPTEFSGRSAERNVAPAIVFEQVRGRRRGFSVAELLIPIGVVGLLLSISIPVLQRARRSADSTLCQSRLKNPGVLYEIYPQDHGGPYPHITPPFEEGPLDVPAWGSNSFSIYPSEQISFWAWPLRGYVAVKQGEETPAGDGWFDAGAPASLILQIQTMTCPRIERHYAENWENDGPAFIVPQAFIELSYLDSPALFSASQPWRHGVGPDLDRIAQRVRVADVRSPSNKTNLIERSTHHAARPETIVGDPTGLFNILACDGHVTRRRGDESTEPVEFVVSNPYGSEFDNERLPYLATENGYEGRDW